MRIDAGRVVGVHRGRPTGEDERMRSARKDLLRGDRVRDELGIHARLSNTTCDQLRVLSAEIHHQHRPLFRRALGHRQNLSAGNSAPPS